MTSRGCSVGMFYGPCGRNMVREDRCIFHLENKTEAEAEQFDKIFQEELKRLGDNSTPSIDLSRFVFPSQGLFDFRYHIFPKDIRFLNTIFKGEMSFYNATFTGKADFEGARFEGQVRFDRAKFLEEAYFYDAAFTDIAFFNRTTFEKEADFTKAKFAGITLFHSVRSKRPESIVFDESDLSRVSFLDTEAVTRISFRNVAWKVSRGRYSLADERGMGFLTMATYANVADVYRRLRRNYESKLRYAEAGLFFKGEMEMKRIAVAPDLGHHSIFRIILNRFKRNLSAIGLYKLLSMYGESSGRVAVWILVSVPLFSIIRTLYALLGSNSFYYSQAWSILCDNLRRSIFVFFQLRSDDLFDVLERIWSGLLLGLVYIALRRQLERHS